MIYKAVEGSHVKGDVQAIGKRLTQLSRDHRNLTMDDIIEDARPDGSPLHPNFEWDDGAAAMAYRREQAGYLLRSIEIVIDKEDTPQVDEAITIRAFYPVEKQGCRRWMASAEIVTERELRKQILDRALEELHGWRQRYKTLKELDEVFQAIDSLECVAP